MLKDKTRLASCLLYNVNKDHLRKFVSDWANNFLVTFFYKNRGLELTDPLARKPLCRIESLRSLLYFGRHYERGSSIKY